MELRTWAAVAVLVATGCERNSERAASAPSPASAPTPAPAPSPAPAGLMAAEDPSAAGPATVRAPGMPQAPPVPRSGSAQDDFPHRKQELVWLAKAQTCLPPQDDLIQLALDSYGGKLVLCAQVMTRRDVSVFFDRVSYACWNLDPATAAVSRRADLGRSYFECQDGSCRPGYFNKAVSYDGTEQVVLDQGKPELSISARPAGTLVRSFSAPLAFKGQELLRGELALVGHRIFANVDNAIYVLDDQGGMRGKLDGNQLQVVDDDHVLVSRYEQQPATLYQIATGKTTQVTLTAPYLTGTIRHAGTFFAIDGEKNTLVTLDPKTLQPRRSLALPICKQAIRPPPPDEVE